MPNIKILTFSLDEYFAFDNTKKQIPNPAPVALPKGIPKVLSTHFRLLCTLRNILAIVSVEEGREELFPFKTEITRQICCPIIENALPRYCKHPCILLK